MEEHLVLLLELLWPELQGADVGQSGGHLGGGKVRMWDEVRRLDEERRGGGTR